MTGVWLGVDVGTVRVGVARCDPAGILASPVTTLRPDQLDELAALVREYEAVGVVIGLPRTLRDQEGASARMARDFGAALAVRIDPTPIEYVDERLTTVSAERKLAERGVRGRARRAVVDQVAAVELLQQWLEARRR
ncbi:MAG: Holliday junction resolvase RuvX [Jatrophihabitans sp.]|uniref:Holliday junction resolvase RuvX n=1 Tax=Jatrophihabitans sp. TaxID=1932789 RepID=UPI003F7F4537